jgi:hypothetical protein
MLPAPARPSRPLRGSHGGHGASLLGLARFAFGAVPPLIGLGGGDDALSLGKVTVVSMTLAVATCAGLMRGCDHARQAPSLRRAMTLECATEAL